MKIKNLTKDERLLVKYNEKVYTINFKKLENVLVKIGFKKSDLKNASGIIKFLEKNNLLNLEFIEYISF